MVNWMVVEQLLWVFQCEVCNVVDGEQVLVVFCEGGLDIVLMDCQMLVLDGYVVMCCWCVEEVEIGYV